MKQKFESGDWVYALDENNEMFKCQVINWIESEQKYIISGYLHRLRGEDELFTTNQMQKKLMGERKK